MKALIEIEAETESSFQSVVDNLVNTCRVEGVRCTIVPLNQHAKEMLLGVQTCRVHSMRES